MKVTELTESKLCLLIQKIMMQSESIQHFSHQEVFLCLCRTQPKELQMLGETKKSLKTEDRVRRGTQYILSILHKKGQKIINLRPRL